MRTDGWDLARAATLAFGLILVARPELGLGDGPAPAGVAARDVLAKSEGKVRAGLWLGGPEGAARYAEGADAVLPTASAIKTAILVELFARHAEALDRPVPGLDDILKEDHPAIAHFNPGQRNEIRRGLAGASVRRVGGTMMGSVPASNLVYNAAANVSIALLGGPEAATAAIRARDAAFAPIVVRRYMLADRKARGDNEATAASLAAVLQRLASRTLAGVEPATIEAIRRAMIVRGDPLLGRTFLKDGELTTDPITSVRTGWRETPTGTVTVFVVMLARDDPGPTTSEAAHQDLVAASDRLAKILLDGAP